MKRLFILLIACTALMNGCGSGSDLNKKLSYTETDNVKEQKETEIDVSDKINDTSPDTEAPENEITDTEASEEKEDSTPVYVKPLDYLEIYSGIIDSFYRYIESDVTFNSDAPEGSNGIQEAAAYMDIYEALENLGYSLIDINDDDVPELILGNVYGEHEMYGSELLAVYTIADKAPELVFEGWSRSSYYLCYDNTIYHSGSGGAAYNCTALYTLPKGKSELETIDYCFSDVDSYDNPIYYSNSKGEWDVNSPYSEQLSENEYDSRIGSMMNIGHQTLNFTSFYNYNESKNDTNSVKIHDADRFFNIYPVYNTVTADESEYSARVVFTAKEKVTDFKIFRIDPNEFVNSGIDSVNINDTVYTDNSFDNYEAVELTFVTGEYIPVMGICYTDPSGKNIRLTINESGRDGSFYLSNN